MLLYLVLFNYKAPLYAERMPIMEILRQAEILYVFLGCIAFILLLILLVLMLLLILLGSYIGVLFYKVFFKKITYDSAKKLLLAVLNVLCKIVFNFLLKILFEGFKYLLES